MSESECNDQYRCIFFLLSHATISWMLAEDMSLLDQRQKNILFMTAVVARLLAFLPILQAPVPTRYCTWGQVMPEHAVH